MTDVTVYHDGKLGRGTPAKIVKNKGKRILISYVRYDLEPIQEWFVKRRRDCKGCFEDRENNFWFYKKELK
jgi:hypothetical protein